MALPNCAFLKALTSGEILASDQYWPQLDAILGTSTSHPFAVRDTTQLWKRAAQWMYCNPDEPWAPETEQLFRLDFQNNADSGSIRAQNRLLQTWLRYSTYTPSKEDQGLIASQLKDRLGLQLMQFASNAVAWVEPQQRRLWLEQSHAEVLQRPTPTPESMYVYLHGNANLLSPAQKQSANRHLCGEMEEYPIGFGQARQIADVHPEPAVWTACTMDLAWSIAKNPGPDDLWPNANDTIGHLDAMLNTMVWDTPTPETTRCLVTAALMEREGNLLDLDMVAWTRRAPAQWPTVKNMLPVIECLHSIPAGPYDSGVAVNRMVPLVLAQLQQMHLGKDHDVSIDAGVFECNPSQP